MRAFDEEMSEGEWELRETYASFGRAVHAASMIETHVVLALIVGEFLMKLSKKAARTGGISAERYKVELRRYKEAQFSQTMGQIIRRVQALTVFDEALKVRMREATRRRNFLIHLFLREKVMSLATVEGMRKLREELEDYSQFFGDLSDEIDRVIRPIEIKFGMNPDESSAFADQVAAKIFGDRGL